MLQKLGLSAIQEKIYLALIDDPAATPSAIAERIRGDPAQVGHALDALTFIGLVSRGAGSPAYVVAPPESAIRALVYREEQELERLHAHAASLAQRLRSSRQRTDVSNIIEIIVGAPAFGARWEQAQRQAQHCIRLVDRPPYRVDTTQNYIERDQIARGVSYKTIYDSRIMEAPGHLQRALECSSWGEEARLLANAPIKIAIVDQSLVLLLLLDEEPTQEAAAILIHPSVLLDSLLELFEQLWQRATPLQGQTRIADHRRDETLLRLLAAGMKDEAIASSLKLSVRTVRRNIHDLCERFGVRSRFQAGMVARARGLV